MQLRGCQLSREAEAAEKQCSHVFEDDHTAFRGLCDNFWAWEEDGGSIVLASSLLAVT